MHLCHLEAHRVHCHLQAAGHYRAVSHSPQQQQQQWLLPGQGQNQPNLPFQGHQGWVHAAYGQPYYPQPQHMAVPHQVAEHQPALQHPGMAHHSPASPQAAHARPQPRQQPSVQHVMQQPASQRVFSTQKSSLNGNARPFVGSAKASGPTSAAADVSSGASGSDVSSSRTSPSTSPPLQGAAAGQILLPVIGLQAIVTHALGLCNDVMLHPRSHLN